MKNSLFLGLFLLLFVFSCKNPNSNTPKESSKQQLVDLSEETNESNHESTHCQVPNGYELLDYFEDDTVNPFNADFDGDGIEDCVMACSLPNNAVDNCDIESAIVIYLSSFKKGSYYFQQYIGRFFSTDFENNILFISSGEVDYSHGIKLKSTGRGDMQLISYSVSSGRGTHRDAEIDLITGQYKITDSDFDGNEKVFKGKAQVPTYTLANIDCHVFEKLDQILSKNID